MDMDDFEIRYVEVCLENRKLKTEISIQNKVLRNMQNALKDLYKFQRDVALICPLAVGFYSYLFDDVEDYYD